jgi:hypothetical protein
MKGNRHMTRLHRVSRLGVVAGLALVVLPMGVTAQDETAESAKLRVGHFSPDAPAVDVYANEAAILTEVPFGVLSEYLEFPAGTYSIAVVAAGADPADGAVIGPVDLTFDPGTMTTVAAANALASIEAQVLADEPNPQEGIAQVRVVHFSADAPAVDIAVDGGDVVAEDLAYPNAAGYVDLPEGAYDLEIRPTGTTDVAFDIDPLPLAGGTSYTVFAIGSLADGTFTVLPAIDAEIVEEGMAAESPAADESPNVAE